MDSRAKLAARRSRSGTDGRARPDISVDALLHARAERYARAAAQPPAIERTVVTFQRHKSRYAVALHELCEIRPLSRWCRLPGASRALPGVVYYRGELLSLLDLGVASASGSEALGAAWVLVVEHASERLGLMADDVMDVLELPAGSIQPLPLTLGEEAETFLGMTTDGVLITDTARLIATQVGSKA